MTDVKKIKNNYILIRDSVFNIANEVLEFLKKLMTPGDKKTPFWERILSIISMGFSARQCLTTGSNVFITMILPVIPVTGSDVFITMMLSAISVLEISMSPLSIIFVIPGNINTIRKIPILGWLIECPRLLFKKLFPQAYSNLRKGYLIYKEDPCILEKKSDNLFTDIFKWFVCETPVINLPFLFYKLYSIAKNILSSGSTLTSKTMEILKGSDFKKHLGMACENADNIEIEIKIEHATYYESFKELFFKNEDKSNKKITYEGVLEKGNDGKWHEITDKERLKIIYDAVKTYKPIEEIRNQVPVSIGVMGF